MTPDSEIPVMPRMVARNAVRLKPVICLSLDRVESGCASFSTSLLLTENAVELYNFVIGNLLDERSCGGVTKRPGDEWATRRNNAIGGFVMPLLGQNELTLSRTSHNRRRVGRNRRFI
jgi:hypothetical protein